MQRAAWIILVCLLAANVALLAQRRQFGERLQRVRHGSALAEVKAHYAQEEQELVVRTGALPAGFPLAAFSAAGPGDVAFLLLASIDDCVNCIQDEIVMLNKVAGGRLPGVAGIQGYLVDRNRPGAVERFRRHLNPAPAFPLAAVDALAHLPGAHTPLVLVVRVGDRRILDAHKPIPEYLSKRNAFYARWLRLLG